MEKPWLLPRLHFSMEVFLPGAFDLSNQARESAPLRLPFHPHCSSGLGFKHWGLSRSPGLQLQGHCATKGTTSPTFPGVQQLWSKDWWEKAQLPPARPTGEAHSRREPGVSANAQVHKTQTILPRTPQNIITAHRGKSLQCLRDACPSHLLSPTTHLPSYP